MAVTIDGTSGINTPGVVNTAAETIATTLAVTGVTTFAAGTAALPAITTTGDTNTGIFFPAADTIAFAEGGAEAVRINSSGNVGIGTTAPTAKLTVVTSTNSEGVIRLGDNATFYGELNRVNATDEVRLGNYGASQNLTFYTVSSERARINSSGELLVGTTSSGSGGTTGAIRVSRTSGNGVYSEAVTTSSGYRFISNALTDGGTFFHVNFMENGTQRGSITSNGSSTSYTTTSDYRLKENIAPMTGALAKVAALKPCTYKWKVDGSDGQGFIAHELAEVEAGCVTGEKDAVQEEQYEVTPAVKDEGGNTVTEAVMGTRIAPVYQGIDTSFLVATLTAAIQEQQALITALTTRITALEAA